MMKQVLVVFGILAWVSPVWAQEKRIEVSGFLGYTLSEGVNIDPVALGGNVFNSVNPTSGFAYGFTFGVFVTENAEVEFQWTQQDSKLSVDGTSKVDFADMKVNTYHGNFVYNWGDEDAKLRPFILGGIGATQYSPGQVQGIDIDGNTQFSFAWGGGVKAYPSPNVGVKLMGRWIPTYIKSDPAGIWCSPYWAWGCYVLADTDYSNQLEFVGGVTFRFDD